MKITLVLSALLAVSYGRRGFGSGDQDWGYVTVRPKAHMFWWLYETTANVKSITQRPLVIWLQGGPGASSTGHGNFAELGPLDLHLQPRNYTWVKDVNVLFIDNPVGSGFSYVEDESALTRTNKQIAKDLVACLEGFYKKRPDFQHVPLYILAESYGGKMTVDFALKLHKKMHSGEIQSKLKGICLIDSWISPIDSVMTWGHYLYSIGAVDLDGLHAVNVGAERTREALEEERFVDATSEWGNTEFIIMNVTKNVEFYNVLKKIASTGQIRPYLVHPGEDEDEKLERIMNGLVREALKLDVTWGKQQKAVFSALSGDFMKSVTHRVEKLLNETDIKVQVVNGQLDLIVDIIGTVGWVNNLQWKEGKKWKSAPRDALSVNGINEGYQKKYGQFSLYWVNRAGHMVPADNPDAMAAILNDLIKY